VGNLKLFVGIPSDISTVCRKIVTFFSPPYFLLTHNAVASLQGYRHLVYVYCFTG